MAEADSLPSKSLDRFLHALEAAVYRPVADLTITAWRTKEPVHFSRRMSGRRLDLTVGQSWGSLFDCAWFRFKGVVPASAVGQPVVLLIDVNGEACVVDAAGNPALGLTNVSSVFDMSLGRPGKRVVPITPRARGGEKIDLWADAGANDLFGALQQNGEVREACIAVCREPLRALHRDMEVLLDLWRCLPAAEPHAKRLIRGLTEARHAAGSLSDPEVAAARRICAGLLARRGGDPSLVVSAIGHAHIDLGWMWPFRESVRKGIRTFATALALLERYPDYVFGASQAQLWQWMKESSPALYARMKAAVRAGRLEPQGAMWVEPDTNVTGGESLVRQVLFGKRFFRDEFGIDVRNLWLPDAFGYSGSLPQILRKSGVDYFMTQKLSWSRTNRFPYHSFRWKGIDGSVVLAHTLPEETYNGPALPRSVRKIDLEYAERDVSGRALMLFGIGDGGGGPGEEHLERLARMKNLLGVSPVRQEPAARFFEDWKNDAARFPEWEGELYLEKHEGTFTTNGPSKRSNRLMEKALREAEWSCVLAHEYCGTPYPRKRLQAMWRDVLLYQFHDVLPGSCIKRVYDETGVRYAEMREDAEGLIRANLEAVAAACGDGGGSPRSSKKHGTTRRPAPSHRSVMLFNSLSWPRRGWLKLGKDWRFCDVPSMGCVEAPPGAPTADGRESYGKNHASARRLENDAVKVLFHRDGSIESVVDKRLLREVLGSGGKANRLALFRDDVDAWDFPHDYRQRASGFMQLISSVPGRDGPCSYVDQEYRRGHSVLKMRVSVMAGSPRIDFSVKARWRETATMLRVSFPLSLWAPGATCGSAFGSITRPTTTNTSWETAKDEIPCHGWVDVSRHTCGTALLADGKYGFRAKDAALELNLLRSVRYTGPILVNDRDVSPGEPHHGYGDQCDHEFVYALYPHAGDHVEGRVAREAGDLAFPVRVVAGGFAARGSDAPVSLVAIEAESVFLETVKPAEDDDGMILRFYESAGAPVVSRIVLSREAVTVEETDLMEEHGRRIAVRGRAFTLPFGPFEIRTVKVRFQRNDGKVVRRAT
jgi:alpha-mannosidase